MLLMQPASGLIDDEPITDENDELSKDANIPAGHDVWED